MKCTFKKSDINNLKVLFLFHRLLYNLLEKRIKNGGNQTNFRSGEQNLPLPPHILRIIQYKTLWSVLLKIWHLKSQFFLFHRLLYNLLEIQIKNGGHQTNFCSGEQNLPLPPHILRIIQYKTLWSVLLKIWHLKSQFFFIP